MYVCYFHEYVIMVYFQISIGKKKPCHLKNRREESYYNIEHRHDEYLIMVFTLYDCVFSGNNKRTLRIFVFWHSKHVNTQDLERPFCQLNNA